MEGEPGGVGAGCCDAVPEMFRDHEVIAGFELNGPVREFDGCGALEQGDPLRLVLVIPVTGRTGVSEGRDVFRPEVPAFEKVGDHLVTSVPGGWFE